MPPIRSSVCGICGAGFKSSLGLASHLRQKKDHQGLPVNTIPSYADPQYDRTTSRTTSRTYAPDWGAPPSPQGGGGDFGMRTPSPGGGGSNFGMGDEEEDVDEGPPDQIFEGAGGDPHDHTNSSGEPNLEGPRIPEPRGEDKEVFDSRRETRWFPYNSRQQFRMARRNVFPIIPTRDSILANCVGRISDRLHPTESARKFTSQQHFMRCLDTIATRVTPWNSGALTEPETNRPYSIFYRNSLAVLQELIGDTTIGPQMKWTPVRLYDNDGNRVYTEMYTANWMWDQQEALHPDQEIPADGSKTIIPLILSSDKTVYGSLSGTAYGWPLYLSVGNIPSQHRWLPTRPHWRAIAMIKDPGGHSRHANSADFRGH